MNRDFMALKQIFSDLSRSQTFSASKYLQWLNVRGLPHRGTIQSNTIFTASGQSMLQQRCVDETQVLMDLSTPRPSGHVINLRNALLSRAGYDEEAEADAIQKLTTQLQYDLDSLDMWAQLDVGRRKSTVVLLSGWSWNLRSRLSHWLRSFVAGAANKQLSNKNVRSLYRTLDLSRGQFELIRTALETLADEAVLADVLGLCSAFNDEQLQASIIETIARHADSFSAIGAL